MQLLFGLFQRQAVSLPEQQFLALKRQGSGIVGVAHFLAFVMIVATSVASLITLAGVVVNRVVESLAHGHTQFTDVANIVISVFFVLVMDTGAVYGATQIRIILERSLDKRALWLHVPLVIVVSLIEGLTYGVMLWTYDPPHSLLQGILIVARASSVPLLSLYLVLARVTPAGTSDIINLANMASGLGLLDDVYNSSKDKTISMARKAEIFQATGGAGTPEAKLNQLMSVLQGPDILTGADASQFVTHAHLAKFAEEV